MLIYKKIIWEDAWALSGRKDTRVVDKRGYKPKLFNVRLTHTKANENYARITAQENRAIQRETF